MHALTEKILKDPHVIQYYTYCPESYLMHAIVLDYTTIQYFKEPSSQMCLIAIKGNGGWGAIKYIQKLPEDVQLYCIRSMDTSYLEYIKNMTDKTSMYAIEKHGCRALLYIQNQSKELHEYAYKNDVMSIRYMKNPSTQIQMHFFTYTGVIASIQNSEKWVKSIVSNRDLGSIFLTKFESVVSSELSAYVRLHENYKKTSGMILDALSELNNE